jgi:hypothetical protein
MSKAKTDGPGLFDEDVKPAKEPKDERWDRLLAFFADTFKEEFGVSLVIDGSDMKHFKEMLRRTKAMPEYSADALQMAWLCYLRSAKQFDRQQGKPVRFFCANVTRFMVEIARSLKHNGNGNGHGAPRNVNTDAAREYLKSRLKK